MTITEWEWKQIMLYKDHVSWRREQSVLPVMMRSTAYTRTAHWGGVTTYVTPIERTVDGMVTLTKDEIKLLAAWQIHVIRAKKRITKMKEQHARTRDAGE